MPAVHRNLYTPFHTDHVVHGYGEAPAIHTDTGLGWALPGGRITHNRDEALQQAEQMDRLIQVNVRRYKRSLI